MEVLKDWLLGIALCVDIMGMLLFSTSIVGVWFMVGGMLLGLLLVVLLILEL